MIKIAKIMGNLCLIIVQSFILLAHAEVLPNSKLESPPSIPPGFMPPPLNPNGVELETRELSDGVYALMSNRAFTDNAGFIVGSEAVLVIDSHFNGVMGQQIVDAIKRVTDLPIKYLLNTNAFGDHVFGNYIFPSETVIVAHQSTIDALKASSVSGMSQTMSRTVGGDLSVFDGVQLRVPNLGFDRFWKADLGGRVVEMHWFGPGMSPSDSIVFIPDANIAWTANMIFGRGTIPWARSGDIAGYLQTLQKFEQAFQPKIMVAGHGELATGEILQIYMQYLAEVIASAKLAVASGVGVNEFSDTANINKKYPIANELRMLMTGFHRWNLRLAFSEVSAEHGRY